MPVGFRLVDRSSEDWSLARQLAGRCVRYVRHRYVGVADKTAVRRFYREQMPLVKWTAISEGNVHGRITWQATLLVRFKRGSESCTITIEDQPAAISRRRQAASNQQAGSPVVYQRPVAVEVLIAPE